MNLRPTVRWARTACQYAAALSLVLATGSTALSAIGDDSFAEAGARRTALAPGVKVHQAPLVDLIRGCTADADSFEDDDSSGANQSAPPMQRARPPGLFNSSAAPPTNDPTDRAHPARGPPSA